MEKETEILKKQIKEKEAEILELKSKLLEKQLAYGKESSYGTLTKLSQNEILRYSRQLILPEIGISGQIALKNSRVLIVGAGGLGCPVATYLCAAGVGKIGIIDHDYVDLNNLHRQLAHNVQTIGLEKSKSLKQALKLINPNIDCTAYTMFLNSQNIENIIKSYDIIVDASDNVPTRYLLNDATVLHSKVLVSGAALRFEGQLTVYHYENGPCYRCLFPHPPPAESVTNCSEGGVLGAVTGIIGCLQALEVIKIATKRPPSYSEKLLIFDGLTGNFKTIKLRNKKIDCDICGSKPVITQLIDYEMFCNAKSTDKDLSLSILSDTERISCVEYHKMIENEVSHILIDVRSRNEFEISKLQNCVNIPLYELSSKHSINFVQELISQNNSSNYYVICRRGNDSQRADNCSNYFPPAFSCLTSNC